MFSRDSGEIRYALVQQKGGVWGFPKGHMEAGETEKETALREIGEETGLSPALRPDFRAVIEYPLPEKPGVIKRVVYFCGEFSGQRPVPRPGEIWDARMANYEEALALLTFDDTRELLKSVHGFLTVGK